MESGYRLAPQQRRLWALGDGPAYRSCCTITMQGDLDRARLRSAAEEVVSRYEALRTCFKRWPGLKLPLQVVCEAIPIAWQEVDGAGWEAPGLRELFHELRQTPVDLSAGPLVHATLVRLSPEQHCLQVMLPSLAADAVSLGNLFREIVEAYRLEAHRGPAAEESVQFLQVSEWLNQLAEDEESLAGREFWRQEIAGWSPVSLPYERRAVDGATFLPEIAGLTFAAATKDDLERRAHQLGTSLETLLLASWATLLWRLAGEGEVVIEKVFDGRIIEDLSAVCGLVARTLPLRLRLASNYRFSEVLRRLQAQEATAWRWQAYLTPLEEQQALGSGSRESFAFEFTDWPSRVHASGVLFTFSESGACIDRFKAKLVCGRHDGELRMDLHFDPTRFDHTAARCLLRQLQELLTDASTEPETSLIKLRLSSPEERRCLIVDRNPSSGFEIPDLCIHTLFERQAASRPDDLAVVYEDRGLTYRELERRANLLAGRLRQIGVGLESPVALCVERSIEMVVGLLGVLKAGGFYVPLDPASPRRRSTLMLQEAGASVLLTQRALLDRIPEEVDQILLLDDEDPGVEGHFDPAQTVSSQLAYVLFTSGSTGRPKGVAVEHRQLVGYVMAVAQRMDLPADASFATVSTFAADLGHTAVFPALCLGGCLHVMSRERVADAEAFADYMATRAVDCLKIVPSHLMALLSGTLPERCLPRQLLVLGGEAASWDLIDRVQALAPACRVMNHYGPTETTVGVLGAMLDGSFAQRTAKPPLGAPFAHARVFVLDADREVVPIGIPGEIYIGGSGLARGYYGSPELTAQRFLPDPFGAEVGGRLYRSGDLAHYLLWGDLEFLGRADQQVKIRGFRVELAEIESLLRQHPAVQDSAVLLREDQPGEKRLVAYVVTKRGCEASPRELREFLQDRVLEPMLPASFVPLAALPLTTNGKLDRKSLPAPVERESDAVESVEPLASPLEEMIAGLWEQLLGVSRVGRSSHFFELGGHSLIATQLVARLREALQVELPLRQLFDAPTVAGLAASLEAAMRSGRTTVAPPIERTPRHDGQGLALSFAQHRLWLSQQLDPDSSAYNIPTSLRVEGPLNLPLLQRSLNELVRRHEVLRTTFRELDGEPLQFIGPPTPLGVPVVDLRVLPEPVRTGVAKRIAAAAASAPFDLATGPLLRVQVLRLGEDLHAVLFAIHHIVSDAWSAAVLIREVVSLYNGLVSGRACLLPDLPIQYADFAAWQRRWQRPEVLPTEVEFWRRQLGGEPPVLDLADCPRPPVTTYRGGSFSRVLGEDLLPGVRALSRERAATSFMTLLAAFKVVLSYHGGTQDLLVGTNVLGRNQKATEGLIGFFLNMVVLRTDLSGGPTFQELLRRVRDAAIAAYAHQDLPFDQLVEILKPKRDPGRHPLFQVIVDYQRLPHQEISAAGLTFAPLDFEFGTAHCDLTLHLRDLEDTLLVSLGYNSDLFTAERARRVLTHFELVLRQVVANREVGLAALFAALAADEERERQIGEEEFKEARRRRLARVAGRRTATVPSGQEIGS